MSPRCLAQWMSLYLYASLTRQFLVHFFVIYDIIAASFYRGCDDIYEKAQTIASQHFSFT